MLTRLAIRDVVLIEALELDFAGGLGALTGETGAGKSILVDALALLMGERATSDVVRHGAEKAVVSCVFETTPGAEGILEQNGIDVEGTEILLRREVSSSGKGRVFINNQPATVGVLRQLAPELALVHAQSETLGAFDQAQQRGLLDRFAGIHTQHAPPPEAVARIRERLLSHKDLDKEENGEAVFVAYHLWRESREALDSLSTDEQERLRMADLWSFQRGEIQDAAIASDTEDDDLEIEKRVLSNAEKL